MEVSDTSRSQDTLEDPSQEVQGNFTSSPSRVTRLIAGGTIATSCLVTIILVLKIKLEQREFQSAIERRDAPLVTESDHISTTPFHITSNQKINTSIDANEVSRVVDRLRLNRFPGLSLLLHSASIYGLEMEVPDYPAPEKVTLKEAIFNHQVGSKYFVDGPIFVETAWGIRNRVQVKARMRWQSEMQAHPGQLLCELAKHGVALDEHITLGQETFTVRDMLLDTISIFNFSEPQIEWNCIALTLYLPPQKEWTNKFGTTFSFDAMAAELLKRELGSRHSSCYGIHLLEAQAILLRADDEYDLLSPAVRKKIHNHLIRQISALERTQLPDGSFNKIWYAPDLPASSISSIFAETDRNSRVHITGHHIDWILLLPDDMLPPNDVFDRAGHFLLSSISACEERDLHRHYCPYSHAARVLLLLTDQMNASIERSD